MERAQSYMRVMDKLFALPCEAIATARCLRLTYDGHDRTVEVHVAGTARDGEAWMRVWQVRGGSSSSPPFGWRTFRLSQVTGERSRAPRAGYTPDDPLIVHVVCQA